MKSTLNSSAYRILATAAIVFATFVAVFFMFNASLSSAGASFFNAAEASTSDAGGFNLDHSWGGGSIGFPYGSFVYGCTDDAATNYDPDADINDRSCIFPPVEGCTDPFATNYDFKADKDDDSCEYPEVEVTSCDLTASAEIIATGGSVTLTWETEGYEEFTLNGQSISDANGNKTFTNVLEDTTYTFVATNSNGDRCQATVTVQCLPPVVPTCESFNITQSTVVPNANLTFNWNTTNATNVSIDNGIGAVTVDGTNEIFQAPAAEGTYTYTLTFDGKTNNSCVDTVKVEKPVVQTPRCDAFNASPVAITEGESSLLTWETTNATRVVINNGIGEVAADSSIEVSPLTSTTYLLTVFGTDNKKVQCEAPVTVTDPVNPGCTDPAATNYDPTATKDDGSCVFVKVCEPGDVHYNPEADLSGSIFDGSKGKVTNSSHYCKYKVGLASYEKFDEIIDNQKLFDSATGIVEPKSSVELHVETPSCAYQIDLFYGDVLLSLDGQRYGTRLLDAKHLNSGAGYCGEVVAPSCDAFTSAPTGITEGESSLLTWETTNATRVVINNGIGEVAADSSIEVSPLTSTTYLLTVFGTDNKKVQCEAPVTVTPKVVPPTCDSFTASPDMIITGGTSTLAWETTNAVSVSINNTVGTVGLDGNTEVALVTGTVFVLTATGEDGTEVTCEAPVQVSAEPVPVCEAFDATPGTLPVNGGSVDLAWTVTGAETVTIDNGVGAVALTGNQSVNVTESTTFTLTAVDSNGDDVSCLAPVAVADPAPVFTCAENVSFTASDTSIDRGDSSRLAWNVTDADSVAISGISATGLTGTEDVSPSSDTTYVLTATKSGFNPIDCNVRIDVSSGGGGGGGSSSPRCELEISDNRIDRGDEITLTWDSSRARELILTDDRGNTIVTTEDRLSDDKEELFDGEITLTPTRDTEYTLRVERGSRDRECTVDVEVEDDEIVLLETRDQAPLVAGISLTEVPYTGFEAGTVMTFLFYALLAAWALYITYVLVIPKTLLSAAPQLVTPRNSADHMTSAESMRPDVFAALSTASVATSTAAKAAAPANLPVATAEPVAAVEEETVVDTATGVENQAHLHQALLSSSAVQSLIAMTTDADRSETLTKVIADAKGAYPLEDGWVVINQTRLTELTTQPAATPTPTPTPTVTALTGNGSLAEAVVTGNVVAAYELIGTRPMFALADASADLDTLYRNRKGANEPVSDFLTAATKDMTDVQIADMIAALTGALDGTYTDEASAVKMAIMKAVKIAA